MTTVNITGEVVATMLYRGVVTDRKVVVSKKWKQVDVMEIGQRVRSWLRREFNKCLREYDGQEVVVHASYTGQLRHPPYSFYKECITGTHGRVVKGWTND